MSSVPRYLCVYRYRMDIVEPTWTLSNAVRHPVRTKSFSWFGRLSDCCSSTPHMTIDMQTLILSLPLPSGTFSSSCCQTLQLATCLHVVPTLHASGAHSFWDSSMWMYSGVLWNVKPCLDCVWNMTAHAQRPHFVFRYNGRVHLNRRGRQFSRLLAADVCASAVVMLDTPCSEVVWRVLVTHSIRQFPLHFPSRASPCAVTFQLDSTKYKFSNVPTTICTFHFEVEDRGNMFIRNAGSFYQNACYHKP